MVWQDYDGLVWQVNDGLVWQVQQMTGPPLLAPTIPSAAYGFPQPNMHYVLQGKNN